MISNLKETIHRVTIEEQKALLREFVAEIRVPQTGEALLMVDPVGLSRLLCLNLVTPRGVLLNATLPSYPIALNA